MSEETSPRPKDGAETAAERLKREREESDRLHEQVKREKKPA